MMRNTCILLSFLFSLAYAQPVGQLYIQSGQNQTAAISYIDYPAGTHHYIQFRASTDLVASPDYLYAAALYNDGEIMVYDRINHQRAMTLPNTDAQWLDMWNDKLVVASRKAPFLRVYDPSQGHAESFSLLDSTVVPYQPIDMLVADDRAYVLLGQQLVVVDLDLEDTLAVIETPPPYPSQNQNTHLVDGGDYIYINVDYATGAIRSSLLKVYKLTLEVEMAYHSEGNACIFPPVAAGDSVFVFQDFSRYDLSDDSLTLVFKPAQFFEYVLAYDPLSKAIFTYGGTLAASDIQYHHASQISSSISLSYVKHVHFAEATTTSIDEDGINEVALQAFPNPTVDFLNLAWNKQQRIEKMRIINPKGQIVWEKPYDQFLQTAKIDVRELSHGGYFLEVLYEDTKESKAFVKW